MSPLFFITILALTCESTTAPSRLAALPQQRTTSALLTISALYCPGMVSRYTRASAHWCRLKQWPAVWDAWPLQEEKKKKGTKGASVAKITPISTNRRPDARRHSSDSGPPEQRGRRDRDAESELWFGRCAFSKTLKSTHVFFTFSESRTIALSRSDGRFPSRVRLASHVAKCENEESETS